MCCARWLLSFLLFGLTSQMVGCGTRTTVAGFSDSPDGKFRLYIRKQGATRRAYNDESEKNVTLTVVKANALETPIFKTNFVVRSSALTSDIKWEEDDSFSITLYDYGAGIDMYDGRKQGIPTRHIRSIRFRFDSR